MVDSHGTAWADYDNDGDQDLLASSGSVRGQGENDNALFKNEAGKLIKIPDELGLSYPLARGRAPLWLDKNKDGLLDVVLTSVKRPDKSAPTAYFQQTREHRFTDRTRATKFNVTESATSAQVTDIVGDGRSDILVQGLYQYPLKAFDFSRKTFLDITNSLFPVFSDPPLRPGDSYGVDTSAPKDAAIADFNGDLYPDVFLPRSISQTYNSSLFLSTDQKLASATLFLKTTGEVGVQFKSRGGFYFDSFERESLTTAQIFIGAKGIHPSSLGVNLDSSNPDNIGIFPHTPGKDAGIFIGYSPREEAWKILFSGRKNKQEVITVESEQPIVQLTPIGFLKVRPSIAALRPIYLLYSKRKNKYVQASIPAFSKPVLGQYAVAGDFDNDMDADLFVTCSSANAPASNLLYRNRGNGTFTLESSTFGATGENLGPHRLDFSWGKKAITADYDNDGFLDIYTSQTRLQTKSKYYTGASAQLFRNLGNGNHWLEIDLRGTRSNRDGIGARILATAGGVTQLREQSGGMHQYSQNSSRIHFGMGQNRQVDALEIRWPSGITQVINDVPVDRVMTITEPA